jgi:hypothetical protein
VLRVSQRLKQACKAKAEALRRPVKYLALAGESKEEALRLGRILRADVSIIPVETRSF